MRCTAGDVTCPSDLNADGRAIRALSHRRVGRWCDGYKLKGSRTMTDQRDRIAKRERLRSLPQLNSLAVRAMGTNLLTIRVDLTD
jgi:hypothetical protein